MKLDLKIRIFKLTTVLVNGLWKLLAFSLILLAITIGSIRIFSNEFSRYKPDLELFLSEKLERKLSIHSISLEWPAQGPRIQLKQLELAQDESQSLNSLVIANGFVAINLWKSIYYRELITDEINFQGIQAKLNPDLLENTATTMGTQKQANIILEWLLRQQTIEIYDSFLLLSSEKKKKFSYALPVLTFHGGKTKHQVKAFAVTASGSEIEFRTEQISKTGNNQQHLKLYLHGNKINLNEFPAALFYPELPQLNGSFNLELWAQWKQHRLDSLFSKTSADEISIGESTEAVSVAPLTLMWKRNEQLNWNLKTSEIIISMNNNLLPPFQLFGQGQHLAMDKQEKWKFSGLEFPLPLLTSITKNYLPENFQDWIKNAQPEGRIENFKTEITFDEDLPRKKPQFEVEFNLSGFNSKQWKKYPGVENIDTQFALNNQGGRFKITSTKGGLNLYPLFRYPLQFSTLRSDIQLIFEDDKTELIWNDFLFNSREINLRSTGKLEFFKDGGGNMDLSAKLNDVDLNFIPWFLPTATMSENLVKYLDENIHQGKLVTASAIIRGPFSSYPFENEDGVFDITAQIKDANLRFLPDWPTLKNLSAELRFFGEQILITASNGDIEGIHLTKTTAIIKNHGDKPSHLLLDITAKGEIQSAIDMLKQSPLKNVPEALSVLHFGGALETAINIDVPLKSNEIPKITGTVKFNKSSITVKEPVIPFENIQGELRFNEHGLKDAEFTGHLWGHDFSSLLNEQSTAEETTIQVTLKSKLDATGISELSGLDGKLFTQGSTDINANMLFKTLKKNKSSQIIMDFSSQLKGLKINIPDILEKPIDQVSPFSLSFNVKNNHTTVHGAIDKNVSILADKKNGHWKGMVAIGKDINDTPIELPSSDMWKVNLQLGNVNLSRWFDISKNTFSLPDSSELMTPFHIEATSPKLKLAGFDFGEAYFELDYKNSLEMSIKAEHVEAVLKKTLSSNEPISINIKSLRLIPEIAQTNQLNQSITSEKIVNLEKEIAAFTPKSIPALKIHCDSCNYGKQALGQIDLETIPAGEHLGFTGQWSYLDTFKINFSGLWKTQTTQLSGNLVSKSFEDFSNFWDISSSVKESNIESSFALSWSGSLLDFDTKTLQGKISSTLSKGHVEDVSAEGAQVFSFLSLQNLKRRLTLDFNDVFEEGFFYDKISGTFLIDQGRAYSNDVKIDGTAADILISGYTDIVHQEFEQHMIVTPKLSSSLPVLAGWAISPPTALVAFLFDKIFVKPALDVVTRIDYKITGPWKKPEIIEIGKQQKEFKLDTEAEPEPETQPVIENQKQDQVEIVQ